MERWQWQVMEAVYAAAQGEKFKAEAVAKLHRMELLFRKTGHVAGEITATGCRGLVQASIARNGIEMLAARQLLMRSVYLAHEQPQEEEAEEVAAAVVDKCALQLSSRVVGGDQGHEEAVGWFRLLQRAPEVHEELRFQLSQAYRLESAGEVGVAVRAVQEVLALLTAPPADESSPWPRPKLHAGLLADAGNLLHRCGHRDAALDTLSQAWDVLTASGCSLDFITDNRAQQPRYILSEDEVFDTSIESGLSFLIVEYLRNGEEAAAALELDAAVNWYRKAADVARVFPPEQRIVMTASTLMLLVKEYQDDEKWAAAQGLLDALAPHLKDSRDFQRCEARQLTHSRHYLQAAGVFKDLLLSSASEDIDDATGTAASSHARLLLSSADNYKKAGRHQLAAKMLDRLEKMIRYTTSWPPPGPDTNDVDPRQHFELELYMARAGIGMETGRYDQVVIWLQNAASLQEAIIKDNEQRLLPSEKHLRAKHWRALLRNRRVLVSVLTHEAFVHVQGGFNNDVKGLEARIERIKTLNPDADTVWTLGALLLLARGDSEEAVEPLRELFLLMAERQEGRGGDDNSWITGYNYGDGVQCMSLAMLVDSLESTHIDLGRHDKALLWAERGRMRLFMHRVHAQQLQEDGPGWAMHSTPNDFDRDDGKALDMLAEVLLASGPNVALLEYSYSRQTQKLRAYVLSSRMGIGHITWDCPGIEQLVKKARSSIIASPQQRGEAAAATNKNRHAQQQLRYLAQLHSLLVAEVLESLPDSCDTLIFVPDGCLSLVPFAALYDESAGQFLIEQKQVVVAPCLRALHRCLDLQDRFFSTASTQLQQPFVAGNPFPMGLGLPQLPHAQEEAAAVADILGVKPCLGAAVTKEAVLKGLGHSSVVMLASHASVGPKFPAGAMVLQGPSLTHDPDMASSSSRASNGASPAASNYDLALLRSIMMYPDSDEPEAALLMKGLQASVTDKSQVLTADELSGMRIQAGLVVLSGSETGRGEVTPEGVLGLGRALLQAGAATTVLSLWNVEDQATKRLMTEMFQELQKGEPVGTALRKAMLKMIQEGSSISHWAAFFIFGSPTMHLRNVTTLSPRSGRLPQLFELEGRPEQAEESQSGKAIHQALEIGIVCEGQERPGHEQTNKMRQDVCSFGFTDFTKPFQHGQIMCLYQVQALHDDEVARIYFLHEEGMACIVGVGLTYSVVTLKAKSLDIYVTEIGKNDWEKMWTTSAQEDIIPTFPILFTKSVEPHNFPSGVGVECPGVVDIEWEDPSISAGYDELEMEVNTEETWKDGEFNFETKLVGKSLLHGLMRSAMLQGQQWQLLPILSPDDARQLGQTRAPAGDSTGSKARTDGLTGITNGSGSEFHRTQSLISKSEGGMNEGNSGEAEPSITGIHRGGKSEGEHRFLKVEVILNPHHTELQIMTPLVVSELPGENDGVFALQTKMVVEFFTNVKSNDESNLSGFREMDVTISMEYGLDSIKQIREDFSNWYHKHLKSSFKCLDDSALRRKESGTAKKTRLVDAHRDIVMSRQITQGTNKGKAYAVGTTLGVGAVVKAAANFSLNTSNQVMASSTTGEQTSSTDSTEYLKYTMFSINDVSNGPAISFTASLSKHIDMDQFWKDAIRTDAKLAGMLSKVEYDIWGRWELRHITNPQEYEVCVQRDLHSTSRRMTPKKGTKGKFVETFETRELLQHLTKRFLISHSFDQTYYRSEEWRWWMQNEPTCPIADVLRQA